MTPSIIIPFVQRHERLEVLEHQTQFELRAERGWSWLQRLAIAVLKWRRAYALDRKTHVSYQTVEIRFDTFREAVLTQIHRLLREDQRPTHVLVGRDSRMLMMEEIHQQMMFSVPHGVRGWEQYEGLRIIFNPSYRGAPLVLSLEK